MRVRLCGNEVNNHEIPYAKLRNQSVKTVQPNTEALNSPLYSICLATKLPQSMEAHEAPTNSCESPPLVCHYCKRSRDENNPQAHAQCRTANSSRMEKSRSRLSPAKKMRENVLRAAKRRVTGLTGMALRTEELCNDSSNVIRYSMGVRDSCPKCGALLWKHEKKWGTICCNHGKVDLPKFEYAPEEDDAHDIELLWKSNCADGKLLRKFARQLNNAVCLASQCVTEVCRYPTFNGNLKFT